MDFRSQLSAFQSGGSGNSGSSSNNNNSNSNNNNNNNNNNNSSGERGRGYSSSNSYSNSRGYSNSNSSSYYGRGNDGRDSRDNHSYHHHRDHRDHRDSNHNNHYHRRDHHHHHHDHKRRNRPWGNNDGGGYGGGSGGGPPQRRRYHSPDRDGLGDLRQFGFIIPKGNPTLPAPALMKKTKKNKTKHIALLAITIDDLPYEHIWKTWIDTLNDTEKDDYFVSLVCHAKFPEKVTSQWLKDRMLLRRPKLGRGNSYLDPEFLSRTPEWGSVEITRAMLDLLQESAKIGNDDQKDARFSSNRYVVRMPGQTVDTTVPPTPAETEASPTMLPTVDQFLFLSETCLPVRTAPETFRLLPGPTVSWINARHRKDPKTPKNKYEDDQFALISRKIPGQFRWKADQWVLLGRLHATAILAMDRPHFHPRHQLWQHFRNINASDEMYIPTAMALLGYLRYTLEGEDTQRARNNMTSSSSTTTTEQQQQQQQQTSSSSTSPNNNNNNSKRDDDKDKPTPNPPPPPEMVLKRPVTYTDWTEGMRNPACFTRGMLDFTKVGLLARAKGCLVARKFAPKVAMPTGKKDNSSSSSSANNNTSTSTTGDDDDNNGDEDDVTQEKGYIHSEEWLEMVQKWEQEDAEKAKLEGGSAENKDDDDDDEEDAEEEEEEEEEETETNDTQKVAQEEHRVPTAAANSKANNKTNKDSDEEGEEEDDDDDDDQQENELE